MRIAVIVPLAKVRLGERNEMAPQRAHRKQCTKDASALCSSIPFMLVLCLQSFRVPLYCFTNQETLACCFRVFVSIQSRFKIGTVPLKSAVIGRETKFLQSATMFVIERRFDIQ